MGCQDSIVWLNHCGGDLGSGVDSKLQLGFLAVVNTEPLHEQGGESRSGSTAEAVEDEESLETSALIGKLTKAVKYKVNDLFSNGIVTSGVVVGGVLLTGDQLFRVEELAVGTSTNLICKNHSKCIATSNINHFTLGF